MDQICMIKIIKRSLIQNTKQNLHKVIKTVKLEFWININFRKEMIQNQ